MTTLTAYLAGRMYLPPGYGLELGANVLLLRRRDGSVVAAFSAGNAAPAQVASTAEADYRSRNPENSPEGLQIER